MNNKTEGREIGFSDIKDAIIYSWETTTPWEHFKLKVCIVFLVLAIVILFWIGHKEN